MLRPVSRFQSPISTASPNAVNVDTPRRQPSRCTTSVNSESEAISRIAASSRSRRAMSCWVVATETVNAASLPTPSTVADNTVIAAGAASSGPSPALRRLALVTDFCALPFPANSLDLIVLPHALESSGDPHALLREVGRVLVPEGRVVICGLNPASLWALRERRGRLYRQLGLNSPSYLPQDGQPIGFWRLRDWLRLLSFEVESSSFGCWQPAMRSERWLKSFEWIDRSGKRWRPIFGALYFVVATKRVRGMRLTSIVRRRKAKSAAGAPVSVANRRRPKSARETAAVEVERS